MFTIAPSTTKKKPSASMTLPTTECIFLCFLAAISVPSVAETRTVTGELCAIAGIAQAASSCAPADARTSHGSAPAAAENAPEAPRAAERSESTQNNVPAASGLASQPAEREAPHEPQALAADAKSSAPASETQRETPVLATTTTPSIANPAPPVENVQANDSSNLWNRIRAGFKLRDLNHALVRNNLAAFKADPGYLARIVQRSRRYLYHIVQEVEKRGMPTEIALLPIVESAFNPTAYSRSHASGIWQFIPSTGKHFGLQQDWWHDERRDIHAATTAALDYLVYLQGRFGSWELALAAYNCGEGKIASVLRSSRGKSDLLSLPLPAETRNYVPKLIAVRNIVRDSERLGLDLAPIPDKPYFTVVTTDKHIDLKRAAAFAEIPVEEFLALNPAFNRPVITATGEHNILVPAETADIFAAKLENPGEPLVSWRTEKLRRGERFESVAFRFGLSSQELKQVNSIPVQKTVAGGGTILVPVDATTAQPQIDSESLPESALPAPIAPGVRHKVRKGETLSTIARRYGVTVSQLKAWNGLKRDRVSSGKSLVIRHTSRA
jgi:membrane-bound lytic murein transglycosylase D